MGDYNEKYSRDLTDFEIFTIFEEVRYPDSVSCPFCESMDIYPPNIEKRLFRCRKCKRKFSILRNTYLENTKLKLREWYEVINCFSSGLSANKASKELQVNKHWSISRLYNRIREAIKEHSETKFAESVVVDKSENLENLNKYFDEFGNHLEVCYSSYEYYGFIICLNMEREGDLFLMYIGDITDIFHRYISDKKKGKDKRDLLIKNLIERMSFTKVKIFNTLKSYTPRISRIYSFLGRWFRTT